MSDMRKLINLVEGIDHAGHHMMPRLGEPQSERQQRVEAIKYVYAQCAAGTQFADALLKASVKFALPTQQIETWVIDDFTHIAHQPDQEVRNIKKMIQNHYIMGPRR